MSPLVNAGAPPLSAWLPDAYPEASWSGTVFLSAFTTKTAVYVLLRFYFSVFGEAAVFDRLPMKEVMLLLALAGIGLFLGIISLKNAGIIAASPATYVTLGDLHKMPANGARWALFGAGGPIQITAFDQDHGGVRSLGFRFDDMASVQPDAASYVLAGAEPDLERVPARAAVAGLPTKSSAPAMPRSSSAACGVRVSSVRAAPSFAAMASLAGSMSQATMFFTPFARSTAIPAIPTPPQPMIATRSAGVSGGSLALAL